jgi:hypothetical protein
MDNHLKAVTEEDVLHTILSEVTAKRAGSKVVLVSSFY